MLTHFNPATYLKVYSTVKKDLRKKWKSSLDSQSMLSKNMILDPIFTFIQLTVRHPLHTQKKEVLQKSCSEKIEKNTLGRIPL